MQHHGKSKKQRLIKLYATYVLMTFAVAIISFVCIFFVLGYRVDVKNGDVELGALLQFRSYPSDASITLDGEKLAFQTPGKQNVDVGPHTIQMKRSGYHDWSRTVDVKPSELRWINYTRFVPKKLVTTTVSSFENLSGGIPSPDKKWFMLLPFADRPELTLVDLRDDQSVQQTKLTLPLSSYTSKPDLTHSFELVEWDFGARYVLVKHVTGDLIEYLRVDRTNSTATVNISAKLGIAISDIHFSGTSGNVFYALESGNIRRLDSLAGTLSQPIARRVTQFELYKNDIVAYVRDGDNKTTVVGMAEGDKTVVVATFDNTVPVYVDVSSYFNDNYLAISRGIDLVVYKDPQDSQKKQRVLSSKSSIAASWIAFSNSGRFVLSGMGTQYSMSDLETAERAEVSLPGVVNDTTRPPQWIDDFHIVSTGAGVARMSEFDGGYQHVLATVLAGSRVTLSDDGKLFYSLAKTQSGGYVLQATQMTVQD